MTFLRSNSAWTWKTSGSGGFSIDVFAACGGVLELWDPAMKPAVFHFGGIGAGLGTPGVKVPKVGSAIGRWLSGRLFNSSGGGTDLHNSGMILKGASAAHRELTRADFSGFCLMADAGLSTPIRGQSVGCFLCGLDPLAFAAVTNPALIVVDSLLHIDPLNPRAVILWEGDTRGLVAGGTVYAGYLG